LARVYFEELVGGKRTARGLDKKIIKTFIETDSNFYPAITSKEERLLLVSTVIIENIYNNALPRFPVFVFDKVDPSYTFEYKKEPPYSTTIKYFDFEFLKAFIQYVYYENFRYPSASNDLKANDKFIVFCLKRLYPGLTWNDKTTEFKQSKIEKFVKFLDACYADFKLEAEGEIVGKGRVYLPFNEVYQKWDISEKLKNLIFGEEPPEQKESAAVKKDPLKTRRKFFSTKRDYSCKYVDSDSELMEALQDDAEASKQGTLAWLNSRGPFSGSEFNARTCRGLFAMTDYTGMRTQTYYDTMRNVYLLTPPVFVPTLPPPNFTPEFPKEPWKYIANTAVYWQLQPLGSNNGRPNEKEAELASLFLKFCHLFIERYNTEINFEHGHRCEEIAKVTIRKAFMDNPKLIEDTDSIMPLENGFEELKERAKLPRRAQLLEVSSIPINWDKGLQNFDDIVKENSDPFVKSKKKPEETFYGRYKLPQGATYQVPWKVPWSTSSPDGLLGFFRYKTKDEGYTKVWCALEIKSPTSTESKSPREYIYQILKEMIVLECSYAYLAICRLGDKRNGHNQGLTVIYRIDKHKALDEFTDLIHDDTRMFIDASQRIPIPTPDEVKKFREEEKKLEEKDTEDPEDYDSYDSEDEKWGKLERKRERFFQLIAKVDTVCLRPPGTDTEMEIDKKN
jgi:hypothetical protein